MKKLLSLILMCCLQLCVSVSGVAETGETGILREIRERGVLRVGTAGDYQPMSYLDPEIGRAHV